MRTTSMRSMRRRRLPGWKHSPRQRRSSRSWRERALGVVGAARLLLEARRPRAPGSAGLGEAHLGAHRRARAAPFTRSNQSRMRGAAGAVRLLAQERVPDRRRGRGPRRARRPARPRRRTRPGARSRAPGAARATRAALSKLRGSAPSARSPGASDPIRRSTSRGPRASVVVEAIALLVAGAGPRGVVVARRDEAQAELRAASAPAPAMSEASGCTARCSSGGS